MSHAHLSDVEAHRVLDATRRFEDLALFHVRFDKLNGGGEVEQALTRLVGTGGRVAVIGPSGCGKSSLISSVLGPLETDLPRHVVPLRIPVAAESDHTVTEPGALARHMVRYVTRWAARERFSPAEQTEFERGVAEVTRRTGARTTREFHAGLPLWLARAEFAREVQSTGEDYESHAHSTDAVEHLKRMVALFEAHRLSPVFVFDDSDTWLRIHGLDRSAVASAFFMRSIRMLCKEITAGLVIAVHDHYLDLPGYGEASQLLTGSVAVPRLTDPRGGLRQILENRLSLTNVEADLDDVIEPQAVDELAQHYCRGLTLREALRVVQGALHHALSNGMEVMSAPLIDQAFTELAG